MDERMERLLQLIKEYANVLPEGETITENTKLIEELGYDSVLLIQLIVDIEDEFEISLSDDDLLVDKLDTPLGLFELICRAESN